MGFLIILCGSSAIQFITLWSDSGLNIFPSFFGWLDNSLDKSDSPFDKIWYAPLNIFIGLRFL